MGSYKMAFVGDVMCGNSFYALGQGVGSSLDRFGKNFLSADIVEYFSSHDLVLCNLESPISDKGRRENVLRSVHMRGRPKAAEYLSEWGITVANVANNHIFEQGYEAAIDTINHLQNAGIAVTGAGEDERFGKGIQVQETVIQGEQVAIIGICLRDEKYAYHCDNLNAVAEKIEALASSGSVVIVSVHWGDEWIERPSISQKETGEMLIKAGASLVIGHHPHVIQGITPAGNDGLIAYSLGNFIFDGIWEDASWSMILSVKMSGRRCTDWECIPIKKDENHRPRFAEGQRKEFLAEEIRRRCDIVFNDKIEPEYQVRYMSDFETLDAQARRCLRKTLIRRMWCFRPVYWPQLLLRPFQRRLKIW